MDKIFRDEADIFPYIDDLLVASETMEEHLGKIEQLLKLCRKNHIKLRMEKCSFFKKKLSYLGNVVGEKGLEESKTQPTFD